MFIFSNFFVAIAGVLDICFNVLYWVIIIRALLSWVNPDPYNAIVQFLYKITEPILEPIRRFLPVSLRFGIDISPFIALLILFFLRTFLIKTLFELSARMYR